MSTSKPIRTASSRPPPVRICTTRDAKRLKGMPGKLVTEYQRHLRHHGVDLMSSTGGVLCAAHTQEDIAHATQAFEQTIAALLEQKLIHTL